MDSSAPFPSSRSLVLVGDGATRAHPRLVGHVRAVIGAVLAQSASSLGRGPSSVDEFQVRILADDDAAEVATGLERGSVRHDLDGFDLEVSWRSPVRSYELTSLAEVTAALQAILHRQLDDVASD